MARLMRKNFVIHAWCVEGHSGCGICKPSEWKGRSREKREWRTEAKKDLSE